MTTTIETKDVTILSVFSGYNSTILGALLHQQSRLRVGNKYIFSEDFLKILDEFFRLQNLLCEGDYLGKFSEFYSLINGELDHDGEEIPRGLYLNYTSLSGNSYQFYISPMWETRLTFDHIPNEWLKEKLKEYM